MAAAGEHAEALAAAERSDMARQIGTVRRELASVRRSVRPSSSAASKGPGVTNTADVALDASLYVALEDRFRGDAESIVERQRAYLPFVQGIASPERPIVDLGCGRGEWLRVLAEAGISAIGVDSNPAFVGEVEDGGSTVVEADLVEYLRSTPEGSVGVITMFQVVEHLPLAVLVDVMGEISRVLVDGGLFLAETPNSLNLQVSATTFWLDPTHQRPLHPELLKFLAVHTGFGKVDGMFSNALGPVSVSDDPDVRRLAAMVDGPGDFALLAWK